MPLCKTDWAQFELAVDSPGEFAVPSDPTLSMTYLHVYGRLLLRATEFDMQISSWGVNLVGLAVALGRFGRVV